MAGWGDDWMGEMTGWEDGWMGRWLDGEMAGW